MSAPQPSPGGRREDAALAVGATVGALMSAASLASLGLLPVALRQSVRRNAARRLHARAGALFAAATEQAGVVIDQAEHRITRETVAALADNGTQLDLPLKMPGGSPWTRLKDTIRDAARNAVADLDAAFNRAADALTGGALGVMDAQKVLDELAQHGLTAYVDGNGRTWGIGSYAEMATRTAASRLALAVQLHLMARKRLDLVMVDKTSAEPGCPQCRPYEYRVLSIAGLTRIGEAVTAVDALGVRHFVQVRTTLADAVAHGLLHPNCRHGLRPFVDGMDMTVPLPSQRVESGLYAVRQKRRSSQREVDRHAAGVAVALTPMARLRANRRLTAARTRLHEHAATYHPHRRKAG
jgi:hypothetical protein